jgi:hypothetical protein
MTVFEKAMGVNKGVNKSKSISNWLYKPLKHALINITSVSGWRDSNPRPPAPHAGAIPGYATSRNILAGNKYIEVEIK